MSGRNATDYHPKPWRVEYRGRFETWHPKSCPVVVDANGIDVVSPRQSDSVSHPGEYDERADLIAIAIIEAVNAK